MPGEERQTTTESTASRDVPPPQSTGKLNMADQDLLDVIDIERTDVNQGSPNNGDIEAVAESSAEPMAEVDASDRQGEEAEPAEEVEFHTSFSMPFRIPFQLPGFQTGLDVLSEEEKQKRRRRAEKFGIPCIDDTGPAPMEEDLTRLRLRAAKFGPVDPSQHVQDGKEEKKKNVDMTADRRLDTVHMYGVDKMSTRDCLNYFSDYGPRCVEWINDSSCNVVFADVYTAKRALVGLSRPIDTEDALDDHALCLVEQLQRDYADTGVLQSVPRQQLELLVWRMGVKNKYGTSMLLRIATSEDVKLPLGMRKPSKWYQQMRQRARSLQQGHRRKRRVVKASKDGAFGGTGMIRRKRTRPGPYEKKSWQDEEIIPEPSDPLADAPVPFDIDEAYEAVGGRPSPDLAENEEESRRLRRAEKFGPVTGPGEHSFQSIAPLELTQEEQQQEMERRKARAAKFGGQ